jgi:hypothetical protein
LPCAVQMLSRSKSSSDWLTSVMWLASLFAVASGARPNGRWRCRGSPPEMVAQMLKRAGKWTWRLERVVHVVGGGAAGGATVGVASTTGLKVVFSQSVPLNI